MAHKKLSFIIGGAQKCGTTTLDAILRLHPDIQMAGVKETHFFDNERYDWALADYRDLDAFYIMDGRMRGEATPITLYWRPAIERLYAYYPQMKIVLLLRDPIQRAYSGWRQEYAAGRERLTFREAIRGGRNRVQEQAETQGLHRYYSYVERGLYGSQLSFLLRYFPLENVHVEVAESMFRAPGEVARRVADFLGIAPFAKDIPQLRCNPAKADIKYPSELEGEDIEYLANIFRSDLTLAEGLIGRGLMDLDWR